MPSDDQKSSRVDDVIRGLMARWMEFHHRNFLAVCMEYFGDEWELFLNTPAE